MYIVFLSKFVCQEVNVFKRDITWLIHEENATENIGDKRTATLKLASCARWFSYRRRIFNI